MNVNEYLNKVLSGQDLDDDSPELKALQKHRKDVERLLREGFPDAAPTIRYGGSKAKGTLIRESYDLDVVCYFRHDDMSAGATLKAIYDNVKEKLAASYYVEPKTSAIRLRSKDADTYGQDFHIDVVPGRFVDDAKEDCFLHQEGGDKDRLKTNLQVHIDHVRDSGVVPAIRLLKLWKVRRALNVKQFAFELLVVEVLRGKKSRPLADQLTHVLQEIDNADQPITVEDPANPGGNDLTPLLSASWPTLKAQVRATLDLIESEGWEAIFGPVEEDEDEEDGGKTAKLRRAAAAVVTPTKPWLPR